MSGDPHYDGVLQFTNEWSKVILLKHVAIGGMIVSARHANFFVNAGGATFDDARRLVDLIRDAVRLRFDVELELEVEIWENGRR